ncbi:hypothetical protein MXD62_20750 [Frankia sp. Mgl5]|nr:hypothetical protein [Frankia sp. Mgl5]
MMTPPKRASLDALTTRQLLARRQLLAGRLGDAQHVLAGSLVEQARRCGKPGCSCAGGAGHGPYIYFSPRQVDRGRLRYVPSRLVGIVHRYVARGGEVEELLAEISAINVELLARRELV